jgi:hypothetical protein
VHLGRILSTGVNEHKNTILPFDPAVNAGDQTVGQEQVTLTGSTNAHYVLMERVSLGFIVVADDQ